MFIFFDMKKLISIKFLITNQHKKVTTNIAVTLN